MQFQSIAQFHCKQSNKYELPKQPDLLKNIEGYMEFLPGSNYEQAFIGLVPGDRIWVLYHFHRNKSWKPMVFPPRGNKKQGVFSTRSPYRPNSIGLSTVIIEKIKGRRLYVKNADLLNETPILDIKPYITDYDSFADCSPSWWEDEVLHISKSLCYQRQILCLPLEIRNRIENFLTEQLRFKANLENPAKRIELLTENNYIIAFRTWRIRFRLESKFLTVLSLSTGYSPKELSDASDPYGDKKIHRQYLRICKEEIDISE